MICCLLTCVFVIRLVETVLISLYVLACVAKRCATTLETSFFDLKTQPRDCTMTRG